jgi:hypothetical protein
MADITNLITQYKTADKALEELEKQLLDAKTKRSMIAREIMETHGNVPFQMDGKEVVATCMKGTYFLRPPFGGKKKAAPATA